MFMLDYGGNEIGKHGSLQVYTLLPTDGQKMGSESRLSFRPLEINDFLSFLINNFLPLTFCSS